MLTEHRRGQQAAIVKALRLKINVSARHQELLPCYDHGYFVVDFRWKAEPAHARNRHPPLQNLEWSFRRAGALIATN